VRGDRPPPLDLRPRPPRESQAGAALRALACCFDASGAEAGVGARLWAAGEAGVRAWDLADAFRSPASQQRWGDEASAPFKESRRTPPTLCLAADPGRGVVWSGHADGRIMGWTADPALEEGECLSWEAHRGPVFALAVSPYGRSPYLYFLSISAGFAHIQIQCSTTYPDYWRIVNDFAFEPLGSLTGGMEIITTKVELYFFYPGSYPAF